MRKFLISFFLVGFLFLFQSCRKTIKDYPGAEITGGVSSFRGECRLYIKLKDGSITNVSVTDEEYDYYKRRVGEKLP